MRYFTPAQWWLLELQRAVRRIGDPSVPIPEEALRRPLLRSLARTIDAIESGAARDPAPPPGFRCTFLRDGCIVRRGAAVLPVDGAWLGKFLSECGITIADGATLHLDPVLVERVIRHSMDQVNSEQFALDREQRRLVHVPDSSVEDVDCVKTRLARVHHRRLQLTKALKEARDEERRGAHAA